MGVTITAENSEIALYASYAGFAALRQNIATAFDEEFGNHYQTVRFCKTKTDYDVFNKKTKDIFSNKRFKQRDADIINFLFAPDCDGEISYKTCKKIYDLIKDIDFGEKIFTYAAYSDGKDYEHFKELLLDCYKNKENMFWC